MNEEFVDTYNNLGEMQDRLNTLMTTFDRIVKEVPELRWGMDIPSDIASLSLRTITTACFTAPLSGHQEIVVGNRDGGDWFAFIHNPNDDADPTIDACGIDPRSVVMGCLLQLAMVASQG